MSSEDQLTPPLTSTITLNNGISMPRLHLGVYLMSSQDTTSSVVAALEAGYRAVDCAEMYQNEHEVGAAIREFLGSEAGKGLQKEDIWFTTKLYPNQDYDSTRKHIKQSAKAVRLDKPIDLYLMHSPYGGRQLRRECWEAVEDAIEAGEVRCGGVSNFGVNHLQQLLDTNPKFIPAVNQIELHPFNSQADIVKFCQEHGIVVQAYSPLAKRERKDDPSIQKLSKKYACTWAQLLVRWSLQRGFIPLPKSVKMERIIENADVGGFQIETADMKILDGLDEDLHTDWDPTGTL